MDTFCYIVDSVRYLGFRKDGEVQFLRSCNKKATFYRYDGERVHEHGSENRTYSLDQLAAEDLNASILIRVTCPSVLKGFGLQACTKPF
ncbi:hypothetical protein CMO91_05825 [Candidatus Woesearchaeota archaeon]|jgi:hypothetical protein|nr:hypothetical protein [Candidatus Woesearchaeota archaeon]